METFEIHITGSYGINAELDKLGIKNIIIDLLKPNKEVLRTEYMSSYIIKAENFAKCWLEVLDVLCKLKSRLIRIKIESPYYSYYLDQSLYLESHFKPFNTFYPISRNVRSNKELATDRTYNHAEYQAFIEKWKGEDIEMCLLDTWVDEDADWFKIYFQKNLELLN